MRILRSIKASIVARLARRAKNYAPVITDGYPIRIDSEGGVIGPGWVANPGDRIGFALNAPTKSNCVLTIQDARKRGIGKTSPGNLQPQTPQGSAVWRDGCGYIVSHTWTVPSNLASGVCFLEGLSNIFVVVGSTDTQADVAVLISTNTFNAYSRTEHRSLYNHPIQASEVSFLRPWDQVKDREWRAMLEYFLDEQHFGKRFKYLTDFDMENAESYAKVNVLVILGHSEYWTRQARQHLDSFVAAGGHVIIPGGNIMKWQVRYAVDNKTLISYKNRAFEPIEDGGDPMEDNLLKTGRWYDARLEYETLASIGGDFVFGGHGIFRHPWARGWDGLRIIDGNHPLLTNLNIHAGDLVQLYRVKEWDGVPIVGLDERGCPIPDLERVGAHKLEIIGYEWSYRGGHTLGTLHIMQKAADSGALLHFGAKDCAGKIAFHPSTKGGGRTVQLIVGNAIRRMLNGERLFLDAPPREISYDLRTPWKGDLPEDFPEPFTLAAPRTDETPKALDND